MRRTLVLLAALSVAGVLLIASGAPPSARGVPGHNGKIAYESFRDGDSDIGR